MAIVMKGRYAQGDDGLRTVKTDSDGRLEVDAIVKIDSMSLEAEMKVDSGHDLYEAQNVTRSGDLSVTFTSVAGLTLAKVQSVENKTQGWIYNTKGATVSATSIALVAGSQKTSYPVIGVSDEIEVVYRGASRLTDKTQMTQLTDGTKEATIIEQDEPFGTDSKGLPLFGKYEVTPTTYTSGDAVPIAVNQHGEVMIDADINLEAEMKVDSGHDLYLVENAEREADLEVKFDEVAGLTLTELQAVENKTQGWVYSTKGATITQVSGVPNKTHIALVVGSQKTGYPIIGGTDEIEVVYRGTSRFTNKTQMTQITDGINEASVIATIKSLKSDLSSVAGTVTNVNGGNRDAGTQTVTLADDDPLTLAQAIPTTITSGVKTITTGGTAEPLVATSLPCKSVIVFPLKANTGGAYAGGSGVTTTNGDALYSGDSVTINIDNAQKVYVNADVSSEGVGFTVLG